MIKKKGGRRPSCTTIFRYSKRQLELFIFLQTFLLVINIRNLRIDLRNELLYLYIFYYVYEGVLPLVSASLLTLKLQFGATCLKMTLESQRP